MKTIFGIIIVGLLALILVSNKDKKLKEPTSTVVSPVLESIEPIDTTEYQHIVEEVDSLLDLASKNIKYLRNRETIKQKN